jgi:hypothetical protein
VRNSVDGCQNHAKRSYKLRHLPDQYVFPPYRKSIYSPPHINQFDIRKVREIAEGGLAAVMRRLYRSSFVAVTIEDIYI